MPHGMAETPHGVDFSFFFLGGCKTQVLCRWKADKAELEAEYASDLAEAKKAHQEKVVKAKKQWEREQKVPSPQHSLL